MFKYGGYAGKILRVDLKESQILEQSIDSELIEKYLGGVGFGTKFLCDEVRPGANPLGEENMLIFMTGPVEGTFLPGAGRAVVVTKSPLTGRFTSSFFGGHFGADLKYAGYDGIIFSGKAERPVYLWVDNHGAELRDASMLWGKDTYTTQISLKETIGDDISTVAIGQGGENMVKFACIISGISAAGRSGTGAVMGSKNLKAIAVRGKGSVKVADMAGLREYYRETLAKIKANPGTGQVLPTYGTAAVISANNALGMLGTRNWQKETFDGAEEITGTTMQARFKLKNGACAACPIACQQMTLVKEGRYKGALTVGPDYETLWALGSNCENRTLESIIAADRLCDEYGLDTITAGAVIAMAMECYEKGLITKADTDGMELRFGDDETVVKLIEMISLRKGFGNRLAEGTKGFVQDLGGDAYKYAVNVKGLEVPAHSARGIPGMAIGYATSNRGGTHQDGRPTAERVGAVDINQIEGKGKYEVNIQRMTTLCDSLITCRMTEGIYGLLGIGEEHAKIVKYVVGMDLSVDDLELIADRIYTAQRLFNVKEGECRETDVLPYRFMNEPIPEGPAKGKYMPKQVLDRLLDETYEERGWDAERGIPTESTLKRLGLI
ncbi:MAG: hypothetical protein VR68_01075 [Peptococcaceae bacterium BRH_c4a]|nr:MAG: hypothetical protein VR68_01075 [Peptococcaceae bacterium BRH_c4a]